MTTPRTTPAPHVPLAAAMPRLSAPPLAPAVAQAPAGLVRPFRSLDESLFGLRHHSPRFLRRDDPRRAGCARYRVERPTRRGYPNG